MRIWIVEHLDPKGGWLIDSRHSTRAEALYRRRTTPSCYQRRIREVFANVPAVAPAHQALARMARLGY